MQPPNSEDRFMAMAIAKAREGIAAGQSPFGAIIVSKGVVVATTHNTVWRDLDPTAHAEVNCIRSAAKALQSISLCGLRDVLDVRAVSDVPLGDPLVEDRPRGLRRDHRRCCRGRLLRAACRRRRSGADGWQSAQGGKWVDCETECAALFASLA